VTVLVDGELRTPSRAARVPRPDVAAAIPSLGDCSGAGYESRFAFEPGDEGTHEVLVIFRSRDGKRVRHYPVRRFRWAP
jgi:hypothetical protein